MAHLTFTYNQGEDVRSRAQQWTARLPVHSQHAILLLLLLYPFNGLFSRKTRVRGTKKVKTSLDLNEARDDGGFGKAVASTGPYANNLHLAPDR